jgi:hypothetical protein
MAKREPTATPEPLAPIDALRSGRFVALPSYCPDNEVSVDLLWRGSGQVLFAWLTASDLKALEVLCRELTAEAPRWADGNVSS